MFIGQFLANEVRVVVVAEKELPQPIIKPGERRHARATPISNDTALAKVAANRIARATVSFAIRLAPQPHWCRRTIDTTSSAGGIVSLRRPQQCRSHKNLGRHLSFLLSFLSE